MSDVRPDASPAATPVRILIDTDPGHDDAVAIVLAHRWAEVVGITTVSGNAPLAAVTHNALALVELLGADTPVVAGADRASDGTARHATHVHGESGLGGLRLAAPVRAVTGTDAAAFIVETARAHADLWLLALGPLTNVAAALTRDRDLARRLAGISLMGGSTRVGNATAVAEFNVWADPEAARIVFRSGANIRMCGLDLTRQLRTDDDFLAALRRCATPVAAFVADAYAFLHDRMETLTGERRASLHDPCALLALTHPALFEFARLPVDVELDGELTRGMTVVDERPRRNADAETARANTAVARRIDAPRALATILDALGSG